MVAHGLVAHSGIDHAELLADAGNEVGCLEDGAVGQRLLQTIEGSLVVVQLAVAGGQRSPGAAGLIDVAVVLEQLQRAGSQRHGQLLLVVHPGIDELQGGGIVVGQTAPIVGYGQMLGQAL